MNGTDVVTAAGGGGGADCYSPQSCGGGGGGESLHCSLLQLVQFHLSSISTAINRM